MPQLLIELFSEEIPARMQKRAEEDLARALGEKLKAHGLEPKVINTFSSPRRIGAVIDDLPAKAADMSEEKKGPRVGAPDEAVQGFLKSAGLSSIDQAQIVADKKGDFYVARIERAGRETSAIAQEIIPEIIRAFPWPKSMRSQSSDLQWVRPLHNILCVFDGKPVKIAVEGVGSELVTWGHRFHAPEPIEVRDAASHVSKLRGAKVLIEREERKRIILEQAKKLCADRKLELVDDIGLLEEVAGLVEWPVTLLGDMDPSFLNLPGEVIRLSMRTHQKYFAVRDPKTGRLAPHFITVANVEAKDGGKAIAAGNARVLSARLSDAQFFWKVDTATPLFTDERRDKLKKIVFHQKLGSVWDKVERVKTLAQELCAVTGADPKLVQDAAYLCKMDLVTETVGEFPELQGQVGRQLSVLTKGTHDSVAAAIEDHYRPLGPNDRVPRDKVAVTLALADKLDTLSGFWAIDERPTGSSDPYALRRAALGVVRILLENGVRPKFGEVLSTAFAKVMPLAEFHAARERRKLAEELQQGGDAEAADALRERAARDLSLEAAKKFVEENRERASELFGSLVAFLADRLKVQLREQGKRHDLVDAVFAPNPVTKEVDDDLVRIVARVEALDAFLKTEDGANLLAGYKRAANILAAEEKKGKGLSDADLAAGLDAKLLKEPAEQALYDALEKALPAARVAVEKEEFAAAMKALSQLRAPVDAFFDKVLVNADDAMLRRNRLLLLSRLREALSAVADFSKIEG
ncbi:glycine--tRNA ligase subunit beta [Terricaulis silvestris]|uniref:Glycine--tRNA ligase beta subunit n=1 Tax=Terricaulis silvestris TaxID=2686094 RepID=A0A6I6MX37_9CAUL|nr:glycine--tRNA ligase subunit beta [Terricaulis silvestris]QGZ95763.1 Glycine--tRNA ligase beta subunit [Terricaulis silvestris]